MMVYDRTGRSESVPPIIQRVIRTEHEVKTTLSFGNHSLPAVVEEDDLFIPGPALPLVVGGWTGGSMIIRTDSLPWPGGWASAGLANLVIEPAFDLPKHEDGEDQPMLCWSIEVDGTGESMRWYFDKN